MSARAILGILGGLGPLAGAHFYRLLIESTAAACDGEHVDVLLDGICTTPDRSAYLLGESDASPLPSLIARAQNLVAQGATLLAIPCNTAHVFYGTLRRASSVPILHIAVEAVDALHRAGIGRVGLLCTRGTRRSGLYDRLFAGVGIGCIYPAPSEQAVLDALIYRDLKGGVAPSAAQIAPFLHTLLAQDCDCVLLACTELSLCYNRGAEFARCYDALTLLARRCVTACGATLSYDVEVTR